MARQRDLAGQQERLSVATWAVLAEKGLAGLTVRAVADRAGCTTGLVMHAFPDKPALLRHARDLLHQRTAERADAAERAAAEPLDQLRAVLLHAASLSADKQDDARVWIGFSAAALADPALADVHIGHNRAFLQRVHRLLRRARPDWADQRHARASTALVALVEGLNTLAALDPAAYPPEAQVYAIDAALRQLRTGSADSPAGGRTGVG